MNSEAKFSKIVYNFSLYNHRNGWVLERIPLLLTADDLIGTLCPKL